MSSIFPLAEQCQVTREVLEQLLLLPDRLTFAAGEGGVAVEPSASSSPSSALTVQSTVGGVVCSFLSEAHVRTAVTNAVVRVHIPRNKRAALLAQNPFVQLQQVHEDTEKAKARGAGASGAASQNGGHGGVECRVGRIVAVLPVPSATQKPPPASAPATLENVGVWSQAERAQLAKWLIVVHLGECVEPFPLKYITNEPITEAEHRVYVQTVAKAQASAAVVTPGLGGLLSSEQAESVKQNVQTLHEVLDVVYRTTSARAREVMARVGLRSWQVAQATAEGHLAAGVKRERSGQDEAPGDGGEKRVKQEEGSAIAGGRTAPVGRAEELCASLGGGGVSESARLAQLMAENAQAHAQLQSLRHLLASKDAEVKRQMQKQRHTQQASEAEAEQVRAKLEEESRARRRERDEAEAALRKERAEKEATQVTVKRLVDALKRFKAVTTEVASMVGLPPDTSKPDDVLAALKTKRLS